MNYQSKEGKRKFSLTWVFITNILPFCSFYNCHCHDPPLTSTHVIYLTTSPNAFSEFNRLIVVSRYCIHRFNDKDIRFIKPSLLCTTNIYGHVDLKFQCASSKKQHPKERRLSHLNTLSYIRANQSSFCLPIADTGTVSTVK